MNNQVNFLVLSDLHISAKKLINQKIVLEALYNDLAVIKDSDIKPDYLIFAGDLVDDPDDPDNYIIFLDEFYLRLLTELSLDERKSFLIPGNHDVSRKAVRQYNVENQSILQNYSNPEFINDIYHSRRNADFMLERQRGFYSTLGALFRERPLGHPSQ
jgi:DNA repair exonuclease SbcCD nuclease subunit